MASDLDNIEGATDVVEYEWAKRTLLVFGQEDIGVSQTALDMADDLIYIKQYGSVRSLNVGTSSGIMMQEYRRQW